MYAKQDPKNMTFGNLPFCQPIPTLAIKCIDIALVAAKQVNISKFSAIPFHFANSIKHTAITAQAPLTTGLGLYQ
jgi:hypothetical protein